MIEDLPDSDEFTNFTCHVDEIDNEEGTFTVTAIPRNAEHRQFEITFFTSKVPAEIVENLKIGFLFCVNSWENQVTWRAMKNYERAIS